MEIHLKGLKPTNRNFLYFRCRYDRPTNHLEVNSVAGYLRHRRHSRFDAFHLTPFLLCLEFTFFFHRRLLYRGSRSKFKCLKSAAIGGSNR